MGGGITDNNKFLNLKNDPGIRSRRLWGPWNRHTWQFFVIPPQLFRTPNRFALLNPEFEMLKNQISEDKGHD